VKVDSLNNLEILDLSKNNLKSIGINSLNPLQSLIFVNLDSNNWDCSAQSVCKSSVPLGKILFSVKTRSGLNKISVELQKTANLLFHAELVTCQQVMLHRNNSSIPSCSKSLVQTSQNFGISE